VIKMAVAPPDVSVVAPGRDVTDARLHRLVGALRDLGLGVDIIGLGFTADAPSGMLSVRTRERSRRSVRGLNALLAPWQARGRSLLVLDPEAMPMSWVRCRLTGRKLIVDLSEDYGTLLADRQWAHGISGALARQVVRFAEGIAAHADLTVVADQHVPPARARRRMVVRNLPMGDYLPAPTRPDPVPRAIYIGDLRSSRGLFDMLDAVAAAPGWLLDLVGPVAADDEPELISRISDPALADRVRLHGRRPPLEAWQVARGAWVGLSLLHDTPAFRVAMPSKVYEYLAAGLAVVVSPLPRQAELVGSVGAGVVAADVSAVTAAFRGYAEDPGLLTTHRTAALLAAKRFDGVRVHREFAASVADLLRAG
jgi:glycosyltransferase involved in cell wall biosynthesis